MKKNYEVFMEFTKTVLPDDVKSSITWKVHCLVVHLPEFLRKFMTGMSIFAEQITEAVHADFKKTEVI